MRENNFFNQRVGSLFVGFSVLLTTLIAYWRIGDLGLRVDELLTIIQMDKAASDGRGFLSVVFDIQQGSHFLPLSMFLNYLRYRFFYIEPSGWLYTALFGHVIVVVLVQRLYQRLAHDPYWGWAAACLFGVAFIHWDSVMWSYNLGLFISAALFILTLLAFESFARTGSWAWGVTCVAIHWLGLLNSTGLEMPFLCLLLYLWMRRQNTVRIDWFQCLSVFVLMLVGVILLLIFRDFMISSERDSATNLIILGLDQISRLPLLIVGALYAGIGKSFIGLGGTLVPALFFFPVAFIIWMLLRPLSQVAKSNTELVLMLFVICGSLLVLPALARGAQPGVPFHWFINTSRYQYIPCIPAAIGAIIIFKNFRFFSEAAATPKPIGIFLLISILLLNVMGLRGRFNYLLDQSNSFARQIDTVLDELRHVVNDHTGPLGIVDGVFYDDTSVRIGWDVRISFIATAYAHDLNDKQIIFIRRDDLDNNLKSMPIYVYRDRTFVNIHSK